MIDFQIIFYHFETQFGVSLFFEINGFIARLSFQDD